MANTFVSMEEISRDAIDCYCVDYTHTKPAIRTQFTRSLTASHRGDCPCAHNTQVNEPARVYTHI